MTLATQSKGSKIAALDLGARLANIGNLIEERLKDVLDIPETLTVGQVLILARIAKRGGELARAGDLIRLGLYDGSNVSYNIAKLIKLRYLEGELSGEGGNKRRRRLKLTKYGQQLGDEAANELDRIEEAIGQLFAVDTYRMACDFLTQPVVEVAESRPERVREDA